jgi:hypothetical protein
MLPRMGFSFSTEITHLSSGPTFKQLRGHVVGDGVLHPTDAKSILPRLAASLAKARDRNRTYHRDNRLSPVRPYAVRNCNRERAWCASGVRDLQHSLLALFPELTALRPYAKPLTSALLSMPLAHDEARRFYQRWLGITAPSWLLWAWRDLNSHVLRRRNGDEGSRTPTALRPLAFKASMSHQFHHIPGNPELG